VWEEPVADFDPQNLDILTQFMAQRPPETAQDMRRLLDGFAAILNADLPQVGEFAEAVPIADGITADVVVPQGAGPHPVLVYLHGGGWVCGSPATHRKLAHRFAEAGYLVVNVDYRLAPEHPFPTPFDDCVAAIRWATREAQRFGGDPTRLAVGGDSAGGNLSAAAAAALADDPARPKAALLIYGVFDFATIGELEGFDGVEIDGPLAEMGEKMTELMVGAYLGSDRSEELLRDPRVSPLHVADRLPPSHVVVGSADPLVLQARALAAALDEAGVAHEVFVDEGMPHGYAQMEFLPAAQPAIDRMVAFLRKHV
jgi:acetyl esterase